MARPAIALVRDVAAHPMVAPLLVVSAEADLNRIEAARLGHRVAG